MNYIIRHWLPWLFYPVTVGATIVFHTSMLAAGHPLIVSTYIPVLSAALVVTLCELYFPHRKSWQPTREMVKQDMLFMAVVQMLLPKVLAFAAAIAFIDLIHASGPIITGFWPHDLPVPAQVLLMLVTAEFFRYWLHRAAHRLPWLWRLHAVHHSPSRLYWLNVGRFHPLEKGLQFLLDSLPFILIGVGEHVVAGYFLVYAVNGFFQHSNIDLRFGYLNYLISSAELHRWHHSRLPAESDNNFGNNLILWDLVFGTWYLPERRRVRSLGLKNRRYPQSFVGLLAAPFAADTTADAVPRLQSSLMHRAALRIVMFVVGVRLWLPLKRASRNPGATQMKVLNGILRQNAHTRFGQKHGFRNIDCYADFRRRVPIQTYESLCPHIEAQARTRTPVLTADSPVMYARTSGTTGAAKDIPVLKSTLDQYRRQQRLFAYIQYRACPQAFAGKGLGIVSPAVEGYLDTGAPYGSVSGHVYKTMPKLVRDNYLIPSEVFEIPDYDLKYLLIVRIALGERDITYLGGANPTSFLRLLEVLNHHKRALADSLDTGVFAPLERLPEDTRARVKGHIRADKARAAELRSMLDKPEITYADLWPNIRLVTMWTGGSCGIGTQRLRKALPPAARIFELGFVSTEFRGTLTMDAEDGGLPVLNHHFFEFIECERWERGGKQTRTLDQLESGRDYYVIVTTGNGLYRYFMNDIVRVTGFFNSTPLLRFVQKGKGVTNITGEKLYEDQVIQAMKRAEGELGFACTFFMMLANEVDQRYELFVEATYQKFDRLKQVIDDNLSALNIEYAAKRCSGRLRPLQIFPLKTGVFETYKHFCIQNGQREGQFKTVLLQNKKDARFEFGRYIESSLSGDQHAPAHGY